MTEVEYDEAIELPQGLISPMYSPVFKSQLSFRKAIKNTLKAELCQGEEQ